MFSTRTPRVQTAPHLSRTCRGDCRDPGFAPVSRPAEPRRGIRLPELASTDRGALDALLDTALVGHFALVAEDGTPAVLPTAVIRDGDRVLCHGSTGSRWMRRLASGVPTALGVTSYNGLVVARMAFESSIRYR